MKKLKRIFCSILVLVSIISLGATASAKNANPLEIAGNRAVSKYTAELRAYVNEVLDNTPEPRLAVGEISLDQIVSDFITQHGNDYDIGLLNKSTRKESIVINDDSRIVINGAVVTV